MEKKTKNVLMIVGGLVLLLIIVGVYFYSRGKKQVTIADVPTDDPATGNQSSGVAPSTISATATAMYNDMKGLNWSGHTLAPYETFMSFSDTDFVKTYNTFNTLYQTDSGETLTKWIAGESATYDTLIGVLGGFASLQSAMATRFAKLNLP